MLKENVNSICFYSENPRFANRTMIVTDEGRTFTYAEVADLENRIYASLPSRSLVIQLCKNHPASIAGYLGALRKGHVPLLVDDALSIDKLQGLIEAYKPNALFVPLEQKAQILAGLSLSGISSGELSQEEHEGYVLLHLAEEAPSMHAELALLLSTSGSTGSPKLIRLSARNLQANAESIAEYLEINGSERPITTLPMEYTFGLSVINSHVLKGATLLLTDRTFFDREFWDFFTAEEATTFSGVPYSFQLLKKLHFEDMQLPSLRVITQAGGKLPADLQEFYGRIAGEKNVRFYIMYGQTEATARMSYLPWTDVIRKAGGIGIAIPGGRFELQNVNHEIINEPDVPGELIYYGANVSLGYASTAEDLQIGDSNHGRLATGDLASRDSEGYFYIVGRLKRFLKVAGKRLSLDSMEKILTAHWPELTFVCCGKDEDVRIYPVGNESTPGTPATDEICRFLAESVGIHHTAFHAKYISEIPRNPAGKILYSELS